jgi:hypothetical protein
MYDLVSAALQAQQLSQAVQLIKQWQREKPEDPWLALAMGQYWEAKGATHLYEAAANDRKY